MQVIPEEKDKMRRKLSRRERTIAMIMRRRRLVLGLFAGYADWYRVSGTVSVPAQYFSCKKISFKE
jgi:hypothetical protein